MAIEIKHDKENQKFYTIVDDKEAVATYLIKDSNTLVFNHTYVPPEFRNRGIAAKLVEYGLNYLKENNLKVIPSCPYVALFIKRNEKFKELLA